MMQLLTVGPESRQEDGWKDLNQEIYLNSAWLTVDFICWSIIWRPSLTAALIRHNQHRKPSPASRHISLLSSRPSSNFVIHQSETNYNFSVLANNLSCNAVQCSVLLMVRRFLLILLSVYLISLHSNEWE